MANILVTGGAGFIGSNLTEALLRRGHWVRVLDNFSTGKRENLKFEVFYPTFEMMEGDIRDFKTCQRAMVGIDYVFHEAALASVQASVEDPVGSNRVNVEGTLNILLSAREAAVRRVVYASSCAVYGNNPVLPKKEEMIPEPVSPYALQKYVGEQYCRLFSELYGLQTISLRYFNVFGPKQNPDSVYSAVIPKFIKALVTGRRPVVFGDGKQSRDFIFVDEVVQANLLALSVERGQGEVFNIGSGKETSLNELLALLGKLLRSEIRPRYEAARPGDIRHSRADIRRAREFLKYDPGEGIEAGLEKTIAYFRKEVDSGEIREVR